MRNQTVVVDINKEICKILKYKQYDNNNLLQIIVEDNYKKVNLEGYKGIAFFQLPSGLVISKDCEIQENIVTVTIDNNILNEYGIVILDLTLSNGEKTFTLFKISLTIEKSIDREEAIIMDVGWDIVAEIVNFKTNEDERVANEKQRIINEEIREANEEIREANEKIREANEEIREANEKKRRELERVDIDELYDILLRINGTILEKNKYVNIFYIDTMEDIGTIEGEIKNGCLCYVNSEDLYYKYLNGEWIEFNNNIEPSEPTKSILLSMEQTTFTKINESKIINVIFNGNFTDKTIMWYSSNPEVVVVSEYTSTSGLLTSKSVGSCTITAVCSGCAATCNIIVDIEEEVITYNITNNLTNMTTNNNTSSVSENESYYAELASIDGYEIKSVVVKMNNVDVTNSVYTPIEEEDITYNITNNLTNVTTNNDVRSVLENESYYAELTSIDGYEIESVVVKMNNVDVTNSVYTPIEEVSTPDLDDGTI